MGHIGPRPRLSSCCSCRGAAGADRWARGWEAPGPPSRHDVRESLEGLRHLAHHGVGAVELGLQGLDGALVLVARRRPPVVGLPGRMSGRARCPVRPGVPVAGA
eukprot:3061480-Alexandrium_andersonii.AAC.1